MTNPIPEITRLLADTKRNPRIAAYPSIITGQVAGSTTFGPASAMRYSLWANLPHGPQEISGIAPVMERWDDTINVTPIKTGTMVMLGDVEGALQLMARELPHTVPCGGQASAKSMETLAAILAMTREQRAILRQALGVA